MKNKNLSVLAALFAAFVLATLKVAAQSGPPAPPPDPFLDGYSFLETNWVSDYGYAPIGFTNLLGVSEWLGNALLLDTTNLKPAFLHYNVVETNSHVNLDFPAGAVFCVFICDWATADTNWHGTGPGQRAYLLGAGDWSSGSPQGFWSVYIDPGGTNLYFGGVSNSASTTYVSTPISWPSNSVHFIGLNYNTNTMLFVDGQLAATGGPVTIVPSANAQTNGFFVGSDNLGYEQARGIFWYLELDSTTLVEFFGLGYFTNYWSTLTNGFASWEAGGGGGGMMSPGSLNHLTNSLTCTYGNAVYLTNMSSSVVPGQSVTFAFAIEGGSEGANYDLFSTTNLGGPSPGNAVWTWLGQGTNCGVYSVTNQPTGETYYILGTPLLATNGSGLTVAWERLIGPSSDGYGTPNAWYLAEGLNPQTPGIGATDSNGDGLANWQEYLYGGNPQVAQTFAVWVAQPNGTSGIP